MRSCKSASEGMASAGSVDIREEGNLESGADFEPEADLNLGMERREVARSCTGVRMGCDAGV